MNSLRQVAQAVVDDWVERSGKVSPHKMHDLMMILAADSLGEQVYGTLTAPGVRAQTNERIGPAKNTRAEEMCPACDGEKFVGRGYKNPIMGTSPKHYGKLTAECETCGGAGAVPTPKEEGMRKFGRDRCGYPLRVGDHVRFRGTARVVEGFPEEKSARGFPLIQLEGVEPGSQDDIDEAAVDYINPRDLL